MASPMPTMTRSSSTDSSISSNITVAGPAPDSESSARMSPIPASTPPTSLDDGGSIGSGTKRARVGAGESEEQEEEAKPSRPKRVKSDVSTYNLKALSTAQQPISARTSRNASGLTGRTLVDAETEGTPLGKTLEKALDMAWELPAGSSAGQGSPAKVRRKARVKEKMQKMAGSVGSVLGKRGRELVEAGKRTFGKKGRSQNASKKDEDERENEKEQPRWKRELDTGPKGLLDEIDLDAEVELPQPPAKKPRLSGKAALKELAQAPAAPAPAKPATVLKNMKRWQKEGLYVGQEVEFDPSQAGSRKKLHKKQSDLSASESGATTSSNPPFLPLPMYGYLDKTRDFVIPFDVFAPSLKKGDERPKDWHQVNRNRLVGEAKDLWERSERLPKSFCVCSKPTDGSLGCDEDCLNRVMQYECNDENCNLSAETCGNRAFASLQARMKKGGAYDVGVEVLKTANRGFGVRACRTFGPGQIIMEYTGEIISEGECQRRMREDYKDKQCYYLMELERGLVIDGTKGSMARFINHSCEPNCEVRMVKVNGTPRMGVFAGEAGIATGEELTYDYNFDNFGTTRQPCYCGTPTCRGFLSKRLNATEQKKALKEESERKRKAAEEAQRLAAEEQRRNKVKTARGSGWRGWVAIDDPEVKEKLKREKKEREEKAKSTDRARRLAARESGRVEREPPIKRKTSVKRRKSVVVEETTEVEVEQVEDDSEEVVVASPQRAQSTSNASTGTEDHPRPTSAASSSTITRKTEITVTETQTSVEGPSNFANNVPSELAGDHNEVDAEAETEKKPTIEDATDAVKQVVKAFFGGAAGSSKLKQSTLSFAKVGLS